MGLLVLGSVSVAMLIIRLRLLKAARAAVLAVEHYRTLSVDLKDRSGEGWRMPLLSSFAVPQLRQLMV